MIPKTIIHLLSGGLDSVTMLYDLHSQGHKIHCLLVDYKQQHIQELQFARIHTHRLGLLFTTVTLWTLKGSLLLDGKGTWEVPIRNSVLLSLAVNHAAYAKADTVTIGCNTDDAAEFPDCRKEFLDAFRATVLSAGHNIDICAPYLDKTKAEIVDIARSLNVPMHEIWSCYKGGKKPCGECPACLKLAAATTCRTCNGTKKVQTQLHQIETKGLWVDCPHCT